MKTTMMKSMMLVAMMSMATAMMAATASNSRVNNHSNNRIEVTIHRGNDNGIRGHETARHNDRNHDCYCRDCQKMRKNYDKHMRKAGRHHNSRHCHECQKYFSYMQRVSRF